MPRVSRVSIQPYVNKVSNALKRAEGDVSKISNPVKKEATAIKKELPSAVRLSEKAENKKKIKMDFDCGEVRDYEYFTLRA